MSETYAVASAKGGVGKTTTVANLGAALASTGESVVVVDADIGMANLAGALGVEVEGATLHDLLAGDADREAAIHRGPAGLDVIPGSPSLSDYRDADPAGLADLVTGLAADYEVVLLDTGAGLSHDTVLPLGIADEVLLVSTPQRDALANTDKSRELVERLDGTVAGLVLTRARPDDDAEGVDATVLERVPDDPAIDESIAAGDPVVLHSPTAPAAAAYRSLTTALFGVEVPGPDVEPGAGAEPTRTTAGDDGAVPQETSAGAGGPSGEAGDETAGSTASDSGASATDAAPSEAEPASEDSTEETDATEADDTEETDAAEADDADSQPPESEAEPSQKSVGPRRDEDVPVTEAEGEGTSPEPPRSEAITDEAESPIDEAEEEEKKGFFRRLFGR